MPHAILSTEDTEVNHQMRGEPGSLGAGERSQHWKVEQRRSVQGDPEAVTREVAAKQGGNGINKPREESVSRIKMG